jgi:hypothetical protein
LLGFFDYSFDENLTLTFETAMEYF